MKGKIFNAQEVQAIISGNKTQFREVIKPQPLPFLNDNDYLEFLCLYTVGQKIFVKEVWGIEKYGENGECEDSCGEPTRTSICYKSDGDKTPITNHWDTAKSMPQWASRLTLQIKEIRVKRLANISEEDAIAEGINPNTTTNINNYFRNLWNATHKKPEEKFGANPWVFVYNFEVVK
jgi:hypothetical protein